MRVDLRCLAALRSHSIGYHFPLSNDVKIELGGITTGTLRPSSNRMELIQERCHHNQTMLFDFLVEKVLLKYRTVGTSLRPAGTGQDKSILMLTEHGLISTRFRYTFQRSWGHRTPWWTHWTLGRYCLNPSSERGGIFSPPPCLSPKHRVISSINGCSIKTARLWSASDRKLLASNFLWNLKLPII